MKTFFSIIGIFISLSCFLYAQTNNKIPMSNWQHAQIFTQSSKYSFDSGMPNFSIFEKHNMFVAKGQKLEIVAEGKIHKNVIQDYMPNFKTNFISAKGGSGKLSKFNYLSTISLSDYNSLFKK